VIGDRRPTVVKIIPARLENGQIVPSQPLPDRAMVRNVSIVLELNESAGRSPGESTLPRLLGLLKVDEDPEQAYIDYLTEKYR
jgi:hypothetical protein